MKPKELNAIINGLRYDTTKATLIAGDDYKDGNYERSGTNRFLYRTPNGRFFFTKLHVRETPDQIVPVSPKEAIRMYGEELPVHRVEFSEAFPELEIRDA